MVDFISKKELEERANAVMFMFKGIAIESKQYYNSIAKKMEIDVFIQNRERRNIAIAIDMDHKEGVNIQFKVECPEEDYTKAKYYINRIPNNVFEERGWEKNVGEFNVRVVDENMYWEFNVLDKSINSRNYNRLVNLFKDILEVIGEYLYMRDYSKVC